VQVEKIHLNEDYYGPNGFHAKDIAIIVLIDKLFFSNGIAPVCIDWNSEYNVVNGDQGKVGVKYYMCSIFLQLYLIYYYSLSNFASFNIPNNS